MAYRLAKALVTLRDNVNEAVPARNRQSDGWIGDASHASRSSDHNPWVKDGKIGVVTALDITHDPDHGVDGNKLSEALKDDQRVKYVIWDRRIYTPSVSRSWRAYKGTNPHNHHCHVSVLQDKAHFDDAQPWTLGLEEQTPSDLHDPVPPPKHAVVKLKDQGQDVAELQKRLGIDVDADFGPKTQRAVEKFQRENKLKVDGIVGPYTWDMLEKKTKLVSQPEAMADIPKDLPAGYGSPKWAIDYLVGHGLSEYAAVALVANLMWESGGNRDGKIDWAAHGDRGRDGKFHSHGAGQWNDRHGRWQHLEQFAEAHKSPVTDPATQLDFLLEELGSTERFVGNKLREDTTLDDAVEDALGYWRPSVPHQDKREAIAHKLWDQYHAAS